MQARERLEARRRALERGRDRFNRIAVPVLLVAIIALILLVVAQMVAFGAGAPILGVP